MKIKQVTDINTDKEKLEELESMLNIDMISPKRRKTLIQKHSDGMCFTCEELATKQIIYDISDSEQNASVVERYCNKHFIGQEKK